MSYAYLFKYIIIGDTGKCLYFVAVVRGQRGCTVQETGQLYYLLFVSNITIRELVARSPTAMVRLEILCICITSWRRAIKQVIIYCKNMIEMGRKFKLLCVLNNCNVLTLYYDPCVILYIMIPPAPYIIINKNLIY